MLQYIERRKLEMLNFREELEKIKNDRPKEYYEDRAEEFLRDVLERLKKLDHFKFKEIKTLHFSNKVGCIFVEINNKDTLFSKIYNENDRGNIFIAIREIIQKNSKSIIMYTSNYFFIDF